MSRLLELGGSIDHRQHRGLRMRVGGLRILDISNPEEPREVGFFDTVPFGEDKAGFAGAWSVHRYFESGVIIMSSIKEGLFVLKKRPPARS